MRVPRYSLSPTHTQVSLLLPSCVSEEHVTNDNPAPIHHYSWKSTVYIRIHSVLYILWGFTMNDMCPT